VQTIKMLEIVPDKTIEKAGNEKPKISHGEIVSDLEDRAALRYLEAFDAIRCVN